jgi:hypothetical protein
MALSNLISAASKLFLSLLLSNLDKRKVAYGSYTLAKFFSRTLTFILISIDYTLCKLFPF